MLKRPCVLQRMLCEDVIVIGSGAAEKMTWLDAYERRTRAQVHAPDQRRVKFTTGRVSPRHAGGSPFGNRLLSSQANTKFAAATGPVCPAQSDAPSGGSTRPAISGLAATRSDRCRCRETPAARRLRPTRLAGWARPPDSNRPTRQKSRRRPVATPGVDPFIRACPQL